MNKVWKPRPEEIKLLRAYAAKYERMRPMQLHLEVGERYNTDYPDRPTSTNLLRVTDDEEWNDTDLATTLPLDAFKKGVDLTEDGRALVDLYVYEIAMYNGRRDHGDLLTNVQAHVETVEGKPRLVKITGTGAPPMPVA